MIEYLAAHWGVTLVAILLVLVILYLLFNKRAGVFDGLLAGCLIDDLFKLFD